MKNKILVLAAAAMLAACGSGSDATDSTLNAQAKQFQRVSKTTLTAASYQNTVQSLYIAYFGRPADPIGLANFEAALLADGAPTDIPTLVNAYATNASLKTLIDSFGTSKESQTLYGTGNATTFVQAVFQNVLGRAPLAEGLNFWVTQINGGGVTQGQAALAIMSAALTNNTTQGLLDAQLIANRITAASYFTTQVAAANATSAYTGATAAGEARTMLAKVTATTDLTAFQAQEMTAIAGLPNYPTIRGTTSAYTAANYVTLDSSGSTIIDAAGNQYAVDKTSNTVVALASGVALNGLTLDVQSQGDYYLMSGGNIVGILGYANTSSGTAALAFLFTANTQTGVGQINVSPGSYSLGCNSNCTTNTAGATPTALQEIDTQVGTGAVATFGKSVTVNYTGWLYSATAANFEGTQFDSSYSRNQPFTFTLGAGTVIEGWDQGVIGMKVGGTRTLIIPSLLGYGASGAGTTIPANAPLVFTVTLVSVQ
jgi:hypothetical protein